MLRRYVFLLGSLLAILSISSSTLAQSSVDEFVAWAEGRFPRLMDNRSETNPGRIGTVYAQGKTASGSECYLIIENQSYVSMDGKSLRHVSFEVGLVVSRVSPQTRYHKEMYSELSFETLELHSSRIERISPALIEASVSGREVRLGSKWDANDTHHITLGLDEGGSPTSAVGRNLLTEETFECLELESGHGV